MFGRVFSLLNVFSSEEKNSPPEKNDNSPLKSKESLTASPTQIDSQCVLSDRYIPKIGEGMSYGVEEVLSDFQKLDFAKNPCDDSSDVINYNEGKEANPFDKIAKYYGRNKNVFLFISMLRNNEQSEKIISIISKKCDDKNKEKFIERKNIYLDRISKGERDAKELLNGDFPGAFFNGPHTGKNRNIHQNLNIKIKPGQTLEISSLFNKKSELEREKIYNEKGKRIATIKKNNKQQRNYCFEKDAICNMKIEWSAEDEKGNSVNCFISLNVNSGDIKVGQATINGEDIGLEEILELARQNKDVLMKGEALYEFLERDLEQDVQSQEEIIKRCDETPGTKLDNLEIGQFSFSPLSEEEIEEEERREYENS